MAKNNQSSKKSNGHGNKQQSSALQKKAGESRTEVARREDVPGIVSPFTFMRRFSEEMDRLFDDFGWGPGWVAPRFAGSLDRLGALAGGTWAPQVEVFERNNQLIIRTDLPGMTKDDIKIDVDDNSLVISGERKSEREEDEEGYYRSERSYGSFYRRVPLPHGVKAEDASADFRDGVLEITMPAPKRADTSRRQIEIGGEGKEQPRARAKAAGQ